MNTTAIHHMTDGFLTTAADLAREDGTVPFPRVTRAARNAAAAHVQRLIDAAGWPALEAVAESPAYATRHPDYATAWDRIWRLTPPEPEPGSPTATRRTCQTSSAPTGAHTIPSRARGVAGFTCKRRTKPWLFNSGVRHWPPTGQA